MLPSLERSSVRSYWRGISTLGSCQPGSLREHRAGRAEIFVLSKQEGGRHTAFASGYSPQLFFGVTDVTATLRCDDAQLVHPGDHVTLDFDLHKPIALEPGMRFAMRESGKTIGAGVVIEVR